MEDTLMYMPKSAQSISQSNSGYMPSSASLITPEKKSLGGFLGNVAESGGRLITDTAGAILNPIDTVKNLISLVKDPQVLVDYYKNRYGKDLLETLYNDPVGVLGDLSTVAGGVGAVAKGIGAVGKLSKTGNVAKVAKVASMVDNATDPFKLVGKVGSKITSKLDDVGNIGSKVENYGKEFTKKGYGQNATVAKFEEKFRPITDVIQEYGIYGKDTDKLNTVISSIQSQFDDIAKRSGRTVKANDFLKVISDKVDELNNSGFVEDKSLAQALSKRTQELIKSGKLNELNDVGDLTTLRKGFDKRIGTYATDATKKGANQLMREALTDSVREATSDILTPSGNTLGETGKKLSELYAFKPIIKQASQRGKTSRAFPLGKVATTTTGGIMAGPVGAVVGYAADTFANSPKGSEIISKSLQKTGKVLKGETNIKLPKTVSKVVDVSKKYAKVAGKGRVINNPVKYQNSSDTSYNPFKKVTVKRSSQY